MQALRFHGRRDLRVETLPDPDPPHGDQLVVRPLTCGICGTDLHEYSDGPLYASTVPHPLTSASLPQILGHEFSAEILAVGPEVESLAVGQRVAIMPIIRCGQCRACVHGEFELCELYACTGLTSPWGGFATEAVIREYQAVPLPAEVSADEGAMIEPAAVALTALRRANLREGDTVLVTGGGPIGALVALLSGGVGASRVVVSEPSAARRAQLERRAIGDVAVDPTADDVIAFVEDVTGGLGVDVAVECSGKQQALASCLAAVRRGGVVAQVGLFAGPATVSPFEWCNKNLRIEAMVNYPLSVWTSVIALVESRRVDLRSVVTSCEPLRTAVGAFERLLSPDTGELKVLIEIGS